MQDYRPQKGMLKRGLKSLVNFPAWMGWADVKNNASLIKRLATGLMTPAKPTHNETYDQAIERLELEPEQLAHRRQVLFRLACFYGFMAFLLLAYTVYLYFVGTWQAVIMSFVLVVVMLSLAFREHFWYFQMYEKRLGCTLTEWLQFFLKVRRD